MRYSFLILTSLVFFALPVHAATYATFDSAACATNYTLSNGDLTVTSNASGYNSCRATVGKSTGKWYWEITLDSGAGDGMYGIIDSTESWSTKYPGETSLGFGNYINGQYINNANFYACGTAFGAGTVLGYALDMTAGTIKQYVNGSYQCTMSASLTGTWYPALSHGGAGNVDTANFGASAFAYSVPSGYEPGLCVESSCAGGGGGGGTPNAPIFSASFDNFINSNYNTLILIGAGFLVYGFVLGFIDFLRRAKKEITL